MKEHTFTCCHCGHPHSLSERILVDDDELCEACADEETVICAHCGERIYRDDNAGDDNTPLLPVLLRPALHQLRTLRPDHPSVRCLTMRMATRILRSAMTATPA